ncbi:unnamed protein product [Prorocentrum cordatum]|uniref:Uncharacterized protein n=1 Tax=Prorocentrum cordatum TaxID=2364126 RepID=A0ABN9UHP7_9DINO|nr:unnamed protein product [Polarella glacialis]
MSRSLSAALAAAALTSTLTFATVGGSKRSMSGAEHPLLDKFCGKYFFNDDRRYNFVAAEKFDSEEEKADMIRMFAPQVPKAREDMPALKIMMLRPGAKSEEDLFVHDTLYNIVIRDEGSILVMECWTGDMQLTVDGKISGNQAEGKTIITLDTSSGKASMDIGGGFGKEKWVMTLGEEEEEEEE